MPETKEVTKAGRKAREFQKFSTEALSAAKGDAALESVEESYTLQRATKAEDGTITAPEQVATASTIPLPKVGGGAASLNAFLKSFRDVEGFDALDFTIRAVRSAVNQFNTAALKRTKNPAKPEEIPFLIPVIPGTRSVDPVKVLASRISNAKAKRAAGEMSEEELQAMRDEVLRAAGLL